MAGGFYEELPAKKISASILELQPDKGRGDHQRRAYEIVDEKEKPKSDKQLREIIQKAFDNDYLYMYYEYMDTFKCKPESFRDLDELDRYMRAKRNTKALFKSREESKQ